MNSKLIHRLLASTVVMGFAVAAHAQAPVENAPAGPAAADQDIGEIVVTGSRIQRPDLVASSPVTIVSGDQFKLLNATSAESLLSQNPQFVPAVNSTVNNGNPGVATIDLRGLGDFRTLVLVNGKRMVSYDYGGVVDVNAIPVALIKRVDVLTGGASAVYGSDAVSGVVNFVLDEDFKGIQVDASRQITSRGDGGVGDISGTIGIPLGSRGNVVLSAGYTKRDVVYQSARKFSEFALSSDDLVSAGGSSTAVPTVIDNTFADTSESYYQIGANNDLVPYYEPYNYAPPNYLIVPQKRYQVTMLGKYELTDGVEAFWRGNYMRSKVNSQSAPSGTFGYSFNIYPDNPYLTDQQRDLLFNGIGKINEDGSTTINIRRRLVESGGRTTTFDNEAWQAVAGLRGEFSGMNWEVFGQYARTKRDIAYLNDVTYARVAQALDAVQTPSGVACRDPSNGCVPINLFTTDPISGEAVSFISAQGAQQDKTSQFITGASLSGDVGKLTSPFASNPVAFAVGAEYRREKASSVIDAAYASGDLIGYGQGQTFPAFSYDVWELFGEIQAPLVTDRPFIHALNLELGFRYSDYSHVGSVESYKFGGDWAPVEGVRFRGMFQRAVRAPNLYEASAPRTSAIDNLDSDPCSGSNPVGNAELTALCVATGAPASQIGRIAGPVSGQINSFLGGNPNLSAEKANTITLGVVIAPRQVSGLTLSVDYYNIKIKNAIDTFGGSPQNVVDGCYLYVKDASSPFCQAIVRNPLSGSLSGGIDYGVEQLQANSTVLRTRGIDVNADYTRRFGESNSVALAFHGTYVDKYSKQGVSFLPATECAGKFGFACNIAPIPRWKHVASATFSSGPVSLMTRWRFIGPVKEDSGTDILASRIGSYSYFDATLSFDVTDNYTFRLGVENIFDKDPPLVGASAGSTTFNAANTFPVVYDVLGTTFFASVRAKF